MAVFHTQRSRAFARSAVARRYVRRRCGENAASRAPRSSSSAIASGFPLPPAARNRRNGSRRRWRRRSKPVSRPGVRASPSGAASAAVRGMRATSRAGGRNTRCGSSGNLVSPFGGAGPVGAAVCAAARHTPGSRRRSRPAKLEGVAFAHVEFEVPFAPGALRVPPRSVSLRPLTSCPSCPSRPSFGGAPNAPMALASSQGRLPRNRVPVRTRVPVRRLRRREPRYPWAEEAREEGRAKR